MRARLRGAEPAAHTYAPLFSDSAQTYVSTTPNTQWGASVADESRRGWG